MRPPSTAALLAVWERGLHQLPVARAIGLLASASPDEQPALLARLPIGVRDARLLTLREWLFGPTLTSLACCPRCAERLELTIAVADIRVQPTIRAETQAPLRISAEGYEVHFRVPNSDDVLAAHNRQSTSAEMDIRRRLLARCVSQASNDGEGVEVDTLPEAVVQAIVHQMSEADPQAEVQLALQCPACGHVWQTVFDIASYLWAELDAWARRTLHEIHVLARAYGWGEAEILRLSPARRQAYLDLIGARG